MFRSFSKFIVWPKLNFIISSLCSSDSIFISEMTIHQRSWNCPNRQEHSLDVLTKLLPYSPTPSNYDHRSLIMDQLIVLPS